MRNRRRDKAMQNDGLTAEERSHRARQLGEQDMTDFENPYVSLLYFQIRLIETNDDSSSDIQCRQSEQIQVRMDNECQDDYS